MTPTSALGGVLTGVIDGALVALLVFAAIYLTGRFRRATQSVQSVAEELSEHTPLAVDEDDAAAA